MMGRDVVEQRSATKLLSGVSDLEQPGLKTAGRTYLRCLRHEFGIITLAGAGDTEQVS